VALKDAKGDPQDATMQTGQAILADIIANPQDDVSRLVYADWLDENGDADRADLIRAQIRLADMEPWEEGYTALDIRCRQLERAHPEWLGRLEPFVSRWERFCGDRDRPFERGFPARVKLTPREFVKHRKYLLAETPVREVRFELNEDARSLAKRPELQKLSAAELAYARDSASTQNALECLTQFAPLQHFGLIGSILSEQAAAEVFAAPALGNVQSLAIMGTRLPPEVEATIASQGWPNLRRLVRVWVSQLSWLRSPWLGQLEELTIYDTEPNLSAQETRLLADVLPGTAVRRLSLGWWTMDVAGGQALSEAVAKSSVRSLAVAQTSMTAEVARAFITPSLVASLNALYFSWATLDSALVERLLDSRLRVCALDHVTVKTLAALERAPGLPELTDLRLGLVWRKARDPFARRLRAILEAGTLPRLVSLTLCDTTPHRGMGSECWDQIALMVANCPASAGLRELHLPAVTRTGSLAIASSPYLSSLQLLNTPLWPQDKDAERALTERFGNRAFLGIEGREL
jgi:uncharacterized protein (TIGR02996 family)